MLQIFAAKKLKTYIFVCFEHTFQNVIKETKLNGII